MAQPCEVGLLLRRDVRGLLASSLGLGLLELAWPSALRTWLATSFGVSWGI